jgi:AcrR family transcriptional regulator
VAVSVPTATASPRPNQRERILDVALDLMASRGADGVSMRQLAQACGVQVAAIYHYFESKDALLAAVIEERRYPARLADRFPGEASGPIEERLRSVFDVFWEGALEEHAILKLLLGEGIRGDVAALPMGAELLETFRTGVAAWLAQVTPELTDVHGVADVLVGQVLTGFFRHVFSPGVDPAEIATECADSLVRVVLHT